MSEFSATEIFDIMSQVPPKPFGLLGVFGSEISKMMSQVLPKPFGSSLWSFFGAINLKNDEPELPPTGTAAADVFGPLCLAGVAVHLGKLCNYISLANRRNR